MRHPGFYLPWRTLSVPVFPSSIAHSEVSKLTAPSSLTYLYFLVILLFQLKKPKLSPLVIYLPWKSVLIGKAGQMHHPFPLLISYLHKELVPPPPAKDDRQGSFFYCVCFQYCEFLYV